MFTTFANGNVITVDWLCDVSSRIMDESCKPKVIAAAMKSIKTSFGDGAVRECFGGDQDRAAMEKLLGAAKLQELVAEFL